MHNSWSFVDSDYEELDKYPVPRNYGIGRKQFISDLKSLKSWLLWLFAFWLIVAGLAHQNMVSLLYGALLVVFYLYAFKSILVQLKTSPIIECVIDKAGKKNRITGSTYYKGVKSQNVTLNLLSYKLPVNEVVSKYGTASVKVLLNSRGYSTVIALKNA